MSDDAFEVGYVPIDHAIELAKVAGAFLRDLCHTFLYVYGPYEEEFFKVESAMGDITVMVCQNEEVVEYIDKTLMSVRRWIQYQRLEGFAVVMVDKDENVAYSYQINFYKPEVRVKRKIADFLVYITDLRKKFFEILNAIRYGERPSDENVGQTPPLRFRILCKLIPETSTVQRPREFVWQKVDAEAVNDALLLPCGTRIDNPIVQADLYGREHRCEEREEEK